MIFEIIYKTYFYLIFLLIKHLFLLQKWIPHACFSHVAYYPELCSVCVHASVCCGVPPEHCLRGVVSPIGMCICVHAFFTGEDAI